MSLGFFVKLRRIWRFAPQFWLWTAAGLLIFGVFVGSCAHLATVVGKLRARQLAAVTFTRPATHERWTTNRPNSSPETKGPALESQRVSQSNATESGRFGLAEVVNAGDDTLDFHVFLEQQAQAAQKNEQKLVLVPTLPQCPKCAALGYALARTSLCHKLGKIRIVRLDLDEFEEEIRNLSLPTDRFPGFAIVGPSGGIVDYLDAGEWNTNDPAEFGPIIADYVQGRLRNRRHHWVPDPKTRSVEL